MHSFPEVRSPMYFCAAKVYLYVRLTQISFHSSSSYVSLMKAERRHHIYIFSKKLNGKTIDIIVYDRHTENSGRFSMSCGWALRSLEAGKGSRFVPPRSSSCCHFCHSKKKPRRPMK